MNVLMLVEHEEWVWGMNEECLALIVNTKVSDVTAKDQFDVLLSSPAKKKGKRVSLVCKSMTTQKRKVILDVRPREQVMGRNVCCGGCGCDGAHDGAEPLQRDHRDGSEYRLRGCQVQNRGRQEISRSMQPTSRLPKTPVQSAQWTFFRVESLR